MLVFLTFPAEINRKLWDGSSWGNRNILISQQCCYYNSNGNQLRVVFLSPPLHFLKLHVNVNLNKVFLLFAQCIGALGNDLNSVLSSLITTIFSVCFWNRSLQYCYRGILVYIHVMTVNCGRNRRPAHVSGLDSILGTQKRRIIEKWFCP